MKFKEIKELLSFIKEKELRVLLLDLATLRKENLEWLTLRIKGDGATNESISYFKDKIKKAIFNGRKPDLKSARLAITDFRKISKDAECLFDLMIYYVEMGTEFDNKYGDLYEQFYTSMENMFIDVVKRLNDSGDSVLTNMFKPRLRKITENATEGWGHKDTLEDWHSMLGKKEGVDYE